MDPATPDVLEHARQVTEEILERMGIGALVTAQDRDGVAVVTLHTPESGLVIGRKGATLDALQLIVGLIVNRGRRQHVRIVLDAEGYRRRRSSALVAQARRAVDEVIETGEAVEIPTSSAYERRIVHMELADCPDVVTQSEGRGPDRYLLVLPAPAADG